VFLVIVIYKISQSTWIKFIFSSKFNFLFLTDGELCYEDLEGLRGWKLNYTVEDILAAQGETDLVFLAKRLKTNLPQILDATYTPDRFIASTNFNFTCLQSKYCFLVRLKFKTRKTLNKACTSLFKLYPHINSKSTYDEGILTLVPRLNIPGN
jgi:hypothetical protein